MALQFSINDKLLKVENISPTRTVLDYIRENLVLTGTKEGCAEGDCGACTIVLAETVNGETAYKAVNSCLLMLPQIDGKHVITVEGLEHNNDDNESQLDPVQSAMVKTDGTQCGFCTPGIIMSLFALRQSDSIITDNIIHDNLAGNLCRCTGYRPIVEAAREACGTSPTKRSFAELPVVSEYKEGHQTFFVPKSIEQMISVYEANPSANLLCGGTDTGLLVSKDRQKLNEVIYTTHVSELLEIEETGTSITFGAAVTYSELLPYVERLFPSFATLVTRIGSVQIRNVGTIGGNIGNASPIGDTLPCLIALDATILLCSKAGERELPIDEFFLGYRKTDLRKGEFIKAVRIPKLGPTQKFRTYKISKRYDQDISAVIGAYRIEFKGKIVSEARIAYGGMAATPKRGKGCEATLTGKPWNAETMHLTSSMIVKDYQPISDFRAGKDYRLKVAANLFERLFQDIDGSEQVFEVVGL